MHHTPSRLALWALGLAAALLAGCASVPPGAGSNPTDPWERYNRHMTEFNERADRAVLKPIAKAYSRFVPQPARHCIGNAFSNIEDVPTALNNLLQGKLARAATDVCRFVVNSTVGLLGCFDVASQIGMDKGYEDFGQTLGAWGLEPGPYFVWPLLGPSTVRDSLGRVAGFYTDPVDYIDHVPTRNTLIGVRVVDTRATLLRAEKLVDRAALDRYQFIRDAYLQRRRSLVHDGNPPPEPGQEGGGTGAINPYDDPEDLDEPAPLPTNPVTEPAAQPAPAATQLHSAPSVTSGNKNSAPTPPHTPPQNAHKAL